MVMDSQTRVFVAGNQPAVTTHVDQSVVGDSQWLPGDMARVLAAYQDIRFDLRGLRLFDTSVVMLTARQPLPASTHALLALSGVQYDGPLALRAGCDLTADNDVAKVVLKGGGRLTYALWQFRFSRMRLDSLQRYPQFAAVVDLILPQVQRLTTALGHMRGAMPGDADLPRLEAALRAAQAHSQ